MYPITECNEVESKTFIGVASKLLYLRISSSMTIELCFTLAVCHICIFFSVSKFALLVRLCRVLFCFTVTFSSLSVLFMYLLRFQ